MTKTDEMTFVVLCRADRTESGEKGRYELATRQVFESEAAAAAYAASLSSSRDPVIVPGGWSELRCATPGEQAASIYRFDHHAGGPKRFRGPGLSLYETAQGNSEHDVECILRMLALAFRAGGKDRAQQIRSALGLHDTVWGLESEGKIR